MRFWQPGVYFSQTYKHQFGSLIRCVIIPVICDAPALRKTAGFTATTSRFFCNFCRLPKAEISNFNIRSWPARLSPQEHLKAALRWLKAPTPVARAKELEENCIRWTELLALPYWDPTKFMVVDAMHNLFLNEFKNHCRVIFGMGSPSTSGDKKMKPHTTEEQEEVIRRVKVGIQKQSKTSLKAIRKGYIICFARVNDIPFASSASKGDIVDKLLDWVRLF
jgi:hypothetical protein